MHGPDIGDLVRGQITASEVEGEGVSIFESEEELREKGKTGYVSWRVSRRSRNWLATDMGMRWRWHVDTSKCGGTTACQPMVSY